MSELTYFKHPFTVNICDWMNKNTGIIAVGKKLPDRSQAELIAFSKAKVPTEEIAEMAKKNNYLLLVSASEGDTNAID